MLLYVYVIIQTTAATGKNLHDCYVTKCRLLNRPLVRIRVVLAAPPALPLPYHLSAVHTTPTIITVHWSVHSSLHITGYEITYFAGVEDTTGTVVTVSGGSTSSHVIPDLSSTVTYRVNIVSVSGTRRSDTIGPVLAARGEHVHVLPMQVWYELQTLHQKYYSY